MAYNNNNRNYNSGGGYYQSKGYQGQGRRGNDYENRQLTDQRNVKPKHSGCKSGIDKNKKPYIQGWKYDKANGMRKFFASPYSGTQEKESGNGRIWQNWFVQITLPSGQIVKTSGMYEPATGKLYISDLSYVMNPKGGFKGYVGPFYYRKQR